MRGIRFISERVDRLKKTHCHAAFRQHPARPGDIPPMHAGRGASRRGKAPHLCGRPIARHHACELFHVEPDDAQPRPALLVEGRRAEWIPHVADVVQLVLDQRAEFRVTTGGAVVRS